MHLALPSMTLILLEAGVRPWVERGGGWEPQNMSVGHELTERGPFPLRGRTSTLFRSWSHRHIVMLIYA